MSPSNSVSMSDCVLTCIVDDPLCCVFLPWSVQLIFPGFWSIPFLFLPSFWRSPEGPAGAGPSSLFAGPNISAAPPAEHGFLKRQSMGRIFRVLSLKEKFFYNNSKMTIRRIIIMVYVNLCTSKKNSWALTNEKILNYKLQHRWIKVICSMQRFSKQMLKLKDFNKQPIILEKQKKVVGTSFWLP